MNTEHLEEIAALADMSDSCFCASRLQLPPEIHAEVLSNKMKEISDRLKAVYREASGNDPWAT